MRNSELFKATRQLDSAIGTFQQGKVAGAARTLNAIAPDRIPEDASWLIVNVADQQGKYLDSVAVLAPALNTTQQRMAVSTVTGDGWGGIATMVGSLSANGLYALLSSPMQMGRPALKPGYLAPFTRVLTARPVVWCDDALRSHDATDLMHELHHDDLQKQLLDGLSRDDLASLVSEMDGHTDQLDAVIVPSNKLDLFMSRISAAMSKTDSKLTLINVTKTAPFKRNKVSNVAVLFELSDGQTVTIVFHSPDATPSNLLPTDTLVSWKWLLNKRDVTAAVSPLEGENVQMPTLARRILKLAEKNSARFQRANANKDEKVKELEAAHKHLEQRQALLHIRQEEIATKRTELDAILANPPAPDLAVDRLDSPHKFGYDPSKDNAIINIPLSRRGDIDAQLQRFVKEQEKLRHSHQADVRYRNKERAKAAQTALHQGMTEEQKKFYRALLINQLAERMINELKYSRKTAREEARADIDHLIKREPLSFLKMWQKYQSSQGMDGEIDIIRRDLTNAQAALLAEAGALIEHTEAYKADPGFIDKILERARGALSGTLPEASRRSIELGIEAVETTLQQSREELESPQWDRGRPFTSVAQINAYTKHADKLLVNQATTVPLYAESPQNALTDPWGRQSPKKGDLWRLLGGHPGSKTKGILVLANLNNPEYESDLIRQYGGPVGDGSELYAHSGIQYSDCYVARNPAELKTIIDEVNKMIQSERPASTPPAQPADPQPTDVPTNTADKELLQSIIDGKADLADPAIGEGLERIGNELKENPDADLEALLNQAADVYMAYVLAQAATL